MASSRRDRHMRHATGHLHSVRVSSSLFALALSRLFAPDRLPARPRGISNGQLETGFTDTRHPPTLTTYPRHSCSSQANNNAAAPIPRGLLASTQRFAWGNPRTSPNHQIKRAASSVPMRCRNVAASRTVSHSRAVFDPPAPVTRHSWLRSSLITPTVDLQGRRQGVTTHRSASRLHIGTGVALCPSCRSVSLDRHDTKFQPMTPARESQRNHL